MNPKHGHPEGIIFNKENFIKVEKYKDSIYELIYYYYDTLDNYAGGHLHIVLHDGNIEHPNIIRCQKECKESGDYFGVFLSDILLCFSEDELYKMFLDNWWRMR